MSEYEIDSYEARDLAYYLRKYPYAATKKRAERVNELMDEILDILYSDNREYL